MEPGYLPRSIVCFPAPVLFYHPEAKRVESGQVDQEPRLRSCALHEPPRSRGSNVAVEVEFTVTLDGSVQNPTVMSGGATRYSKRVRDLAILKAQSCRFFPAKKDGVPVPVRMSMWFRW